MKESEFIKSNKDKWSAAETSSVKSQKDFYELYNEVSNDSAYAQTRYKNRSVRVYLNYLLVRLHGRVLNKKRDTAKGLFHFWKMEVPRALWEGRYKLLLSFLVFLLCVFLGYYSSSMDSNFFQEFFGDSYTTTTIQNIEKGDPLAVYKGEEPVPMFFKIGFNNIRVGLFAFALGCIFGIGSLFMMVINGVMLGSFMQFFIQKGLWKDFTFTVWMHGTFEIAMLIVVASAGLVMGYGLVNKGNYSTSQSFYKSAKRGITILVATLPFTILAAFIESFITRATGVSNIARGAFIIICLLITLYYFVIYPFLLNRKGAFEEEEEVFELTKQNKLLLNYRNYRFPMQMSLNVLNQNLKAFIIGVSGVILLTFLFSYLFPFSIVNKIKHITAFNIGSSGNLINLFTGMALLPANLKSLLSSYHWVYLSFPFSISMVYLSTKMDFVKKVNSIGYVVLILIMTAYWLALVASSSWLALLVAPFFFSILAYAIVEKDSGQLIHIFKYGLFNSQVWFSYFLCIIISYFVAYLLHSPLFWIIVEVLQLFIAKDDIAFEVFSKYILMGLAIFCLLFFCTLFYLNVLCNYIYKKETTELNELEEAVNGIKASKQILGYEVE